LNEEDKDAAEAEAAEQEAIEVQANAEAEAAVQAEEQTAAGSTAEPVKPQRTDNPVTRNPVKRVLMPINRPVETQKTAKPVAAPGTTAPAVKSPAPGSETRPRRAQTN
jgi:hypothetical protein